MDENNVQYYLDNYLDIIVQETLNLSSLLPNYTNLELQLYFKRIDALLTKIKNQDKITNKALLEFQRNYDELKQSLNNKLEYIRDTAETFNKLNKTFDTTEFKQIQAFSKLSSTGVDSLLDFSLKKDKTNFNLTKEIQGDDTIIFYNSNSNFHTNITFENIDKDYISSVTCELLYADGTVDVDIKTQDDIVNNSLILETNPLISLSARLVVSYVDSNITNKLDILEDIVAYSSLYTYSNEGSVSFNEVLFDSPEILTFNQIASIPSDTYINYEIKLNNLTFTIPIGNSIICKRADKINSKEIKSIVGIYKDNFFTNNIKSLSEILDKQETYVLYYPKLLNNVVINNFIKIINDYSFKFLYSTDIVSLKLTVELFSFDVYSTPKIKNIVGYAK